MADRVTEVLRAAAGALEAERLEPQGTPLRGGDGFVREAAALRVAGERDGPVPRLLAVAAEVLAATRRSWGVVPLDLAPALR